MTQMSERERIRSDRRLYTQEDLTEYNRVKNYYAENTGIYTSFMEPYGR